MQVLGDLPRRRDDPAAGPERPEEGLLRREARQARERQDAGRGAEGLGLTPGI